MSRMPRPFGRALRTRLVAACALALVAAPAGAQLPVPAPAAPQVTVGQRLRLGFHEESRTGALVGRLTQQDATHMSLDTRSRVWTLSWSQLRTVEVSHPRSLPAAAGRGAVAGALVFMSAIALRAMTDTRPARDEFDAPRLDAEQPSVGRELRRAALWGAGLGLVVGATFNRERWEPVAMPQPVAR